MRQLDVDGVSLTWLDGEGEYEVIRWIIVVRTRVPAPEHAQYVIIHLRQPPIQSARLKGRADLRKKSLAR